VIAGLQSYIENNKRFLPTANMRAVMDQPKDAKEKVREYMERRQGERRQNVRAPLHGAEEIQREIGWDRVERRQGTRREGEPEGTLPPNPVDAIPT
jgi:hypothetical protein